MRRSKYKALFKFFCLFLARSVTTRLNEKNEMLIDTSRLEQRQFK